MPLCHVIPPRHATPPNKQTNKHQPERQAIMDGIFGAVASTNEEVRRCAFECLSRAADLYYDHLRDHMVQACNVRVFVCEWECVCMG